MKNATDKIFMRLPRSKDWKKEEFPVKVKETIFILNEDDSHYQINKSIINSIYLKLISKDLEYNWSIKEYNKFKSIFSTVGVDMDKYILDSILRCLEASKSEIIKELLEFDKALIHPNFNLCNDQNIKRNSDSIDVMDCFKICRNLVAYMFGFINNYCKYLDIKTHDVNLSADEIDLFLKKFDEEFSYLKDFSLFNDIYFKVRGDSVKMLISKISSIKSKKYKIIEKEIDIYFQQSIIKNRRK